MTACRRRYGHTFTLRVPGVGTTAYLDDPVAIKTVFAGDPTTYHAGEDNSMLTGLLGPASVLVVEADEYLDAVAKETLRIRPVVFDVGRVLTRPVEIAGYRLPAGVLVVPGVGLAREVLCRAELATTSERGERQKVKHVIPIPQRGARTTLRRNGFPRPFHGVTSQPEVAQ